MCRETIHRDEWWGHAVSVDYLLFTTAEMTGYLCQAGFEVVDIRERDPYPDVEHPSRRSYMVARKRSYCEASFWARERASASRCCMTLSSISSR